MAILTSIGAGLKTLMGFSSAVDSATKIIDKVAGTDFTSKEKAQFILDYQKTTVHQSVPRRVIALGVFGFWLLLSLAWFVCAVAGSFIDGPNAAVLLQSDIQIYMSENLDKPFNIILAFYFVTAMIKR